MVPAFLARVFKGGAVFSNGASAGLRIERDSSPGARNSEDQSGRWALLGLAAYFALQMLTRVWVSGSLQLDESEQLLLTQDWRWGYGSQPPLYNWLQKGLFAVLGLNVFALALLKNSVLWSIYFFVYLTAREIFTKAKPSALAAASLLFLPQVAWESQRDQSHLILATACAAATLLVFFRLLRTLDVRFFVAFGAIAALGFLSKYNYIYLPFGLIAAAFSLGSSRAVVQSRKMLLAGLVFLAILAPHLVWMLQHGALVGSQSHKFTEAAHAAGFAPYLEGARQFTKAALMFVAAPCLIYAPWLWAAFRAQRPPCQEIVSNTRLQLLGRTMIWGLALILGSALAFRVGVIRDRWLEPLLFALPILLVGWTLPQLRPGAIHRLLCLAAVIAALVLFIINGTVLGANWLRRAHNLNAPYAALAEGLRRAGFTGGTIVADGFLVGGNLRMQFPGSRVIVEELPHEKSVTLPVLIVWNEGRSGPPSAKFLDFASSISGATLETAERKQVEAPCDNGPRRSERLGFILLENQPN